MKKLILLCFLFIFSGSFYAQESKTKSEPVKKETTKKKSGYDYDKDVPVKSTKKETTSKSTATKETTKKKSGYDYDKDVPVKSTKKETTSKSTATKSTATKETTKKSSGYNYDKEIPVKSTKKETTAKSTTTKETTKKKSEANKVAAKIKDEKYSKGNLTNKAPTLKESNEKAPKTPNKVTGEYNGKKVYTGPRGGKYYINKNGNKTYIQD